MKRAIYIPIRRQIGYTRTGKQYRQPSSYVRKLRNLGSRDFAYQALPLKFCSGAKVICARARGEPGDEASIYILRSVCHLIWGVGSEGGTVVTPILYHLLY